MRVNDIRGKRLRAGDRVAFAEGGFGLFEGTVRGFVGGDALAVRVYVRADIGPTTYRYPGNVVRIKKGKRA